MAGLEGLELLLVLLSLAEGLSILLNLSYSLDNDTPSLAPVSSYLLESSVSPNTLKALSIWGRVLNDCIIYDWYLNLVIRLPVVRFNSS